MIFSSQPWPVCRVADPPCRRDGSRGGSGPHDGSDGRWDPVGDGGMYPASGQSRLTLGSHGALGTPSPPSEFP